MQFSGISRIIDISEFCNQIGSAAHEARIERVGGTAHHWEDGMNFRAMLLAGAAMTLIATSAHAQDQSAAGPTSTPAPAPAPPTDDTQAGAVGDIIVTA